MILNTRNDEFFSYDVGAKLCAGEGIGNFHYRFSNTVFSLSPTILAAYRTILRFTPIYRGPLLLVVFTVHGLVYVRY